MNTKRSLLFECWLDQLDIFACGVSSSTKDNYPFLKGITGLAKKNNYKLKVCYEYKNRGDRWMQVWFEGVLKTILKYYD